MIRRVLLGACLITSPCCAQFTQLAQFDVVGGMGFGDSVVAIAEPNTAVKLFNLTGEELGIVTRPDLSANGTSVGAFGQEVEIIDGMLFVSAPGTETREPGKLVPLHDGHVFAYDLETLELLYTIRDPVRRDGRFGWELTSANGLLAITNLGSNLYVIEPSSGEIVRSINHVGGTEPMFRLGVFGRSADAVDGLLFVGERDFNTTGDTTGAAHIFEFPSGNLVKSLLPEPPHGPDARFGFSVAATSERVFAVSADNIVYAYDHEGTLVGTIESESNVGNLTATDEFLAMLKDTGRVGEILLFDPITLDPLGSIDGSTFGRDFGRRMAVKGNLLLAGPIGGTGPARLFLIPEPSSRALCGIGMIVLLSFRRFDRTN